MSYTPTTWVEKVTKVGPTNLNHLENGLQAAAAAADSASALAAAAIPKPSTPSTNNGLVWNGSAWVADTIKNANIDAAAAIALSKLADPGSGKVVTSAGAGAIADFPPGYILGATSFTANATTTATTEATAATIVTAPAINFDGATAVLVEFFAYAISKGTSNITFWLYDGSGSIGAIAFANGTSPCFVRVPLTPSNASHTFSIRASVDAGTGTAFAGPGGLGSQRPGYIKVVRA